MTETTESARRWSGYVCPDCRFVFRVPRDHDGKGIVCPNCRRMLKIPTALDVTPPLLAPLRRTSPEEPVTEGEPVVLKKRRKGRKSSESHSWEHDRSSRSGERTQMRLFLIGGAALLALIVTGAIFSMGGGRKPGEPVAHGAPQPAGEDQAPPKSGGADPADSGNKAFFAEAESLARKFLTATTVEEVLPLVRHPEETKPRMLKLYPEGKIEAPGISRFNPTGQGAAIGNFRSVEILTGDFESKALAFSSSNGSLKIDWESWIGWSDMAWDEFLSARPGEGHVFRVTLELVDYYNFDFKDDSKWQSYRLISPDQEHAIYGYAERDSTLDKRIRPNADSRSIKLMLSLKFPKDATSDDQVEIEKFVNDGWLEEEENSK